MNIYDMDTIKLYAIMNTKFFKVGETINRDIVATDLYNPHLYPMPLDALQDYLPSEDIKKINQYRIVKLSGKIHSDGSKITIDKNVTIDEELSLDALIQEQLSYFEANGNNYHFYIEGDKILQYEDRFNSVLYDCAAEERIVTINNSSDNDGSIMVSGGYHTQVVSYESFGIIASNGEGNQLTTCNIFSIIASSGESATLSANATGSILISTGDNARLSVTAGSSLCISNGKNGRISISAKGGVFMGVAGTHVAVFDDDDRVGFVTGTIGQDGLKENTWYEAKDGKLVEFEETRM